MSEVDQKIVKTLISDKAKNFIGDVNQDLPENMELKFEGFFQRGFFVTKKRYALIVDDRIVVKGLELVRRDWAPVAKKTQEKVLMAILKDGSPKKAAKIIKTVIEELNSGVIPLDDLVIHTQLTKNPDDYVQKAPHVIAARKALKKGLKVGPGSIIRYVVIRGKEPINERAVPVECVDISKYDPSYYINNQILPAVSRILDAVGYSKEDILYGERQSNLDAFF